jgi:hypothetical protein
VLGSLVGGAALAARACLDVVTWFKNQGRYVGGVPTHWRGPQTVQPFGCVRAGGHQGKLET